MEKKLYPLKFIPVASRRPWGGNALIAKFGKRFVEWDDDGNETVVGADVKVGESWELADMGFEDSVIENGWLAGNTISELMETYLERVVGEDVYNYYGRQFPLLVKFLDIQGKLSVQVHPDDEIAAERYDALGKAEIWYVTDAVPGAKVYMGFNREVGAQEFYDRCHAGTVDEVLNVIYPKKGDVIYITPGTVHAAEGGLLIAEIQESSDMTFRLYDWGREFDPETARQMHLEEAIDLIDYGPFDAGLYRKGPLWEDEASYSPCVATVHECHCHEHHCHEDEGECCCHEGECHCHGEGGHGHTGVGPHGVHVHDDVGGKIAEMLVESLQFNVTKLNLTDPLHIYTEKFGSFIVYVCIEGAASVQVPSVNASGAACMDNYEISAGETILIPAELPDFFLVPRDRSTVLLEAVTRPVDEVDAYIDPDTDVFLEDEDYEGLEDEAGDGGQGEAEDSAASPLGFFGAGRSRLS